MKKLKISKKIIVWMFVLVVFSYILSPFEEMANSGDVRVKCYNNCTEVPCPKPERGEKFYGYGRSYDDLLQFLEKKNIHGDLVVVDVNTSLMWQQSTADTDGDGSICYMDKVSWDNAKTYCENLNLAGFKDWRLPSLFELFTIVSPEGGGNPVFNACCFECRICSYWSSTPVKNNMDYVWEVYLYNGNAYWVDKDNKRYVLCVRSIKK